MLPCPPPRRLVDLRGGCTKALNWLPQDRIALQQCLTASNGCGCSEPVPGDACQARRWHGACRSTPTLLYTQLSYHIHVPRRTRAVGARTPHLVLPAGRTIGPGSPKGSTPHQSCSVSALQCPVSQLRQRILSARLGSVAVTYLFRHQLAFPVDCRSRWPCASCT